MLYLVATPIGNLEDITLRALRVLNEADVIIAEDTRHTGLLLAHFKIPHKPMLSLYDDVEAEKVADLILLLKSDQKVALVSDAGTPLISDPGYKLVREAVSQGVKIESVPGPSAVTTALAVSGLPPDKFLFLGYPPEKETHQRELFEKVKTVCQRLSLTVVLFTAPHKLLRSLELLKEILGDIEIVVARELTKVHEEVWRGKISSALVKFARPKGEFVVLWHI